MTKQTRYFMAGSAAVVVVGLSVGLVGYYSGGFQALSASTGPTELAYVPVDTAIVAYADVRAIMDSELRQRLKETMPMPEKGQEEFQAQTGIDIERDIDYIVAAMATPSTGSHPSGLIVARGRFDNVKLEGLAREHGGTVEEYRGKRLVSGNAVHHPVDVDADGVTGPTLHATPVMTIAFLEPGLVAVGENAAVKHAIDANMSAQSITSNNEMMELVSDIERSNNAWAVGRFDVLASNAKMPEQVATQMRAVKWFAAAGHINGGVTGMLRAEARDDQAAENLRDVVRGVLALGRLQAQSDPRLAAVAQSLELTGTGKTVSLSFTLPGELLDLLPKAAQMQH
jgi:hypothetical protein